MLNLRLQNMISFFNQKVIGLYLFVSMKCTVYSMFIVQVSIKISPSSFLAVQNVCKSHWMDILELIFDFVIYTSKQ